MNKEEIRSAVRGFREEFKEQFPDEDPTRHITRFCSARISERIEDILKRWFGFRPGLELLEILNHVSEEESKKAADRGKRSSKV